MEYKEKVVRNIRTTSNADFFGLSNKYWDCKIKYFEVNETLLERMLGEDAESN